MVKLEEIICEHCGNKALKPKGELDRQRRNGRNYFFCSISCGAKHNNYKKYVDKICPICDTPFKATIGRHEATFCSRSCASAGSVTALRRESSRLAGKNNWKCRTLQVISKGLRNREWWKYVDIDLKLKTLNLCYEFEYALPNTHYIFDLAVHSNKNLFEFDGSEHRSTKQKEVDIVRDMEAKLQGWEVYHIDVESNTVIDPDKVIKLLGD